MFSGYFTLACCTGWMLGSVPMAYMPVVSKDVGKAFISEIIYQTSAVGGGVAFWSYEGVIFEAGLGCFCCMLICVGLLIGCNGIESMGVLKVTCFVVLFCLVRASSVVLAVSLGILNLRIPSWSDAACKSRISRLVESLKAKNQVG